MAAAAATALDRPATCSERKEGGAAGRQADRHKQTDRHADRETEARVRSRERNRARGQTHLRVILVWAVSHVFLLRCCIFFPASLNLPPENTHTHTPPSLSGHVVESHPGHGHASVTSQPDHEVMAAD
eukprot:2110057-Rhodomonas_salina.2